MRRPVHMLTHVESSRTMATGLSSGRILVVDDDPAVRHLISDYFGQHGIQTVSATGRSAVGRQLACGATTSTFLIPPPAPNKRVRILPGNFFPADAPVLFFSRRVPP